MMSMQQQLQLQITQQQQQQQQQQHQQQQQQYPSPALSSPGAGFRSSPLFASGDPPDPSVVNMEAFTRSRSSLQAGSEDQAPPKQLANALDGLTRAVRLIADVRSGADLLMEALDRSRCRDLKKSTSINSAVESTKVALDDLRSTGRELESTGVLLGAQQRYEDNQPWGLQVPLVCPDGAVVAYSWKRQIAGQAAATAVDKTRLALKTFTEQKKRFLPYIDSSSKRGRLSESSSLADVLKQIESECPGISIVPRQRSEWMMKHKVSDAKLSQHVAVLEVTIPGIARAILSLLPSGSANPDQIAVFSLDEVGGHVNAWGTSLHQVYSAISECGTSALHYFVRVHHGSALLHLLRWLFSYRCLLSTKCKQCGKILAVDFQTKLLLPPTVRPFNSNGKNSSKVDEDAYHRDCFSSISC